MIFFYYCSPTGVYEGKRRGKSVLVPGLIQDYNVFMGGVNRVNQMLSAYLLNKRDKSFV